MTYTPCSPDIESGTPLALQLEATVAGSSFSIKWDKLREWSPMLDSADSIRLHENGREVVRVDLGTTRRWIAFRDNVSGSLMHCVGFQESVGAIRRGGAIMGGSNFKLLAFVHPNGRVHITES